MIDDVKVPVVPETTADESLIENPREAIEQAVITENETIPEPIPAEVEEVAEEVKKEDVVEDPLERIKKSVQKRIDKKHAQLKTAEEELAEARAEIERLKANPKASETTTPKDDAPPTPEQVEAYILNMKQKSIEAREIGDKSAELLAEKEAIAANRYLIKIEKELAVKAVRDEQDAIKKQAEAKNQKQLADWTNLSKDYLVYTPDGKVDAKNELNLSNQQGLLYKTALALYQDKELHADFYNDPDTIQGFRRAVSDAYREIHQQGLIKSPKVDSIESVRRNPRIALAEPDAAESEEPIQRDTNHLSDAEKVREEIKNRNKIRNSRKVS